MLESKSYKKFHSINRIDIRPAFTQGRYVTNVELISNNVTKGDLKNVDTLRIDKGIKKVKMHSTFKQDVPIVSIQGSFSCVVTNIRRGDRYDERSDIKCKVKE